MASSPGAVDLRRRVRHREVVRAATRAPFEDASAEEIGEAFDEAQGTVRSYIQETRERGYLRVTRTVGPAKLYKPTQEGMSLL